MPMDFPDMPSLVFAAKAHKFREPNPGEPEDEFRRALAAYVEPIDYIESLEIRNKVGWDRFTPDQNMDMLRRKLKL
jgi:hypothetical protein